MISRSDRAKLLLQRAAFRIFGVLEYVIIWTLFKLNYRIMDIDSARKKYWSYVGKANRPVIICANHLTLLDPFLVVWAISPLSYFLFRPKRVPWQIPEKKNFFKNFFISVVSYVGKSIPVIRRGSQEENRATLDKFKYLLQHHHTLLIFPEGGRSRLHRVDTENYSYGVGRIIQAVPDALILCAFLRGKGQRYYSDYPRKGEEFYFDIEPLEVSADAKGLRGSREIASQIIGKLVEMEAEFFRRYPPADEG